MKESHNMFILVTTETKKQIFQGKAENCKISKCECHEVAHRLHLHVLCSLRIPY
jgi:hypothetical protein